MLDAVRVAFNAPENLAGISRLAVTSRFSIIQPLPYAHLARMQVLRGVE
jgi:putative ABC transport system permease protein